LLEIIKTTLWGDMQYRREIDGLRAVAVLPVILFHAGFSVFSGGYIGVDVFFVISGYLITTILINELEEERFSIARFYERRARRILPALFFVMLACLPFAYMWMFPSQLKDFAQSLVAVVFFGSNILFWRESGYFAADAELMPLLHTWSLAVEEQYYIVFPIFLLLAWRFGRNKVFWSVVVIAAISLLLSEWGWRNKPSANFYLAPTRAWELFAGSICAFLTVGRTLKSNNVLSAIGLAAIVVSIFAFDDNTPFPSVYALVPVVGTALIILFGRQGTWVAYLLSMRAFVGIGLISYSAYLWHQPLFAFARLRSLTEPSHILMAVLAAAALLLAWATWRWVEQPFRKRSNPVLVTRRSVFVASGAVGAVFVAIGLAGHVGKGFKWRFDSDVQAVLDAAEDRVGNKCDLTEVALLDGNSVSGCVFTHDEFPPSVAMFGDSHANSISKVLGDLLQNQGISYLDVSYNGCIPFSGLRLWRFGAVESNLCEESIASFYEYVDEHSIETIVLTARFPLYLRGDRFDNGEGGVELREHAWGDAVEVNESNWADEARRLRVVSSYEENIRNLARSYNVVLVYPIPEAGWDVPNHLARIMQFEGSEMNLTTSFTAYEQRTQEVNVLFDRLVEELPKVFGARVQEAICSEEMGRCLNADQHGVYYFDNNHLSNAGARLVAPIIVEAIEATLGR
jgi:peptidoglycan/LPS O-acetylase OafA/YrhL